MCATSCATTYSASIGGNWTSRQLSRISPFALQLPHSLRALDSRTDGVCVAMRPTFYNAYNNLATCYGELKMYPEAIAALETCIKLKPDDYYAMSNLAVLGTGHPISRPTDRTIYGERGGDLWLLA